MPRAAIDIPVQRIAEFCQRNHIRRLSLFGSALRHDFSPESDVDLLVEFEPGHTPGLQIVTMQQELSRMLGRTVDLRTRSEISSHFRDRVAAAAEPIYDRA